MQKSKDDEQTIVALAVEALRWRYRALKAEQGHEPYPADVGCGFDDPTCRDDQDSLQAILNESYAKMKPDLSTAALIRFGAKRRLGDF